MRQHSDGSNTPVIDASVHIFSQSNQDLRQNFMREPFRSRGFPDYEMDWYGAPGGEYVADEPRARRALVDEPRARRALVDEPRARRASAASTGADRRYPGSDPSLVGQHLFVDGDVDVAILHPMTRGIMPDRHLGTAIASAHNDMLVTRWLEDAEFGDRFRGTIRVNPDDIAGALREIDKYKDHPRVVQIGVPLQSRELYGKPQYWPLWEAAAAANLAVAVHIEVGTGVSLPPTPNGNTRTYEQYLSFMSLNYLYHLMNLIAEGVFERMPALKFVWADGAADLLTPFIWRMDCFGRPHLEQTPWAPKMPSDYLPGHVFFVQSSLDGPGDADFAGAWAGFTGKDDMTMFGSSYPHWNCGDLVVPSSYSLEQRDKLCWRNAADLYGIKSPVIPSAVTAQ